MPNYRGFESYTKFTLELKNLRQIYDITYHLYLQENKRLKGELPEKGKVKTVNTTIGYASHDLNSLYLRTKYVYPFKLRQLILISAVTALEVYLTDTIKEAFDRDLSFFQEDIPLEYQKNFILSLPSIDRLRNSLILKDIRSITSGGFLIAKKYYKKRFKVEFENIGINLKEVEEIHIRRHIHVHRNGICDSDYEKKYPDKGFKTGEYLKIEHDYLVRTLEIIKSFGEVINKSMISLLPETKRKTEYFIGRAKMERGQKTLMLEFDILEASFNPIPFFNTLKIYDLKFSDYIVQVSIKDLHGLLIITGPEFNLYKFFKLIKSNKKIELTNTIEMKA